MSKGGLSGLRDEDLSNASVYTSALRREVEIYRQLIKESEDRGDFDSDLKSLLQEVFREMRSSIRDLREQVLLIEDGPDKIDAMRQLCSVVRCSFLVGSIISRKSTDLEPAYVRINRQMQSVRGKKKDVLRSPYLQKAVEQEAIKYWKNHQNYCSESLINATAVQIVEAVNAHTRTNCETDGVPHENVKHGTIRRRLKDAWPKLVASGEIRVWEK